MSVTKPLGIACALTVFLACAASPLFAADGANAEPSQYSLGDQTMAINAGLYVPLFLLPSGTWLLAGSPPHLSLGVVGSLAWAAYVTPQIRVGAEVGGNFTLSPNSNTLFMLPILAKASYVFTAYPFDIPVSFALGMNIVKYVDKSTIDLLLRPGVSVYWVYSSSWSFGLNFNYWFDMQFGGVAPANPLNIGNFLEISLSALYHY
jgi:hypothetical protein